MTTTVVDEQYKGPGPSPLVSLPFETWSRISLHISRETAFAASTASRRLRGVVFPLLFEHVHVRIQGSIILPASQCFLFQEPARHTLIPRHYVEQLRISYEPFPGEEIGGFLLANLIYNTVSHLPRLQFLHIDIGQWDADCTEAALFRAALANCPPFDVRLLEFDTNEGLGDALVKQCTGLQVFRPSPTPFVYNCPTEPVLRALLAHQPDLKAIHLEHNQTRRFDGEASLRSVVHNFPSLELLILSDSWWKPYLTQRPSDHVDVETYLAIVFNMLGKAKSLKKFVFDMKITMIERLFELKRRDGWYDSSLEPNLTLDPLDSAELWSMAVVRKIRRSLPHLEYICLHTEEFDISSSKTTGGNSEALDVGWGLSCRDMLTDVVTPDLGH